MRGQVVRKFILDQVEANPQGITRIISEQFGISRQAANKHLKRLVEEGVLTPVGRTKDRTYELAILTSWKKTYPIVPGMEEHEIWQRDVAPVLGELPPNVRDIWQFCVTEMINNAIDHSNGSSIEVSIGKTAVNALIVVSDDGIGIFRKIQSAMGLADESHAILELSKGKLTTDPRSHSGQGIFFTSRMLDSFTIHSGALVFLHDSVLTNDWLLNEAPVAGTQVLMRLNHHSSRSDRQVFDEYSSGEDYGFTKTVIPVRLAQYGEDKLVSRSQAKRLLVRVDRFKTVVFDFTGVEMIGQAFADEIFRVFAQSHPQIEITGIKATPQIQGMINAARAHWGDQIGGI